MKFVLVINAPDNCYECPCSNEGCYLCQISRRQLEDDFQDRRPDWCTLKSLPEWKDVPEYLKTNRDWEAWGYDQCLTEILGDAEGETE